MARKFDYMEFSDGYGVLFDSDVYDMGKAIEIYLREYGDRINWDTKNMVVEEDYVKWKPKMSKEDMWYFDIYDPADNRGIYQCCSKDAKRAFKVWRIRSKEESKYYESH